MSEENRDETALEALREERDELEYEINFLLVEQSIAHVLRHAAGLPAEARPLIQRSDEQHLPPLGYFAYEVRNAPLALGFPNPRVVEAELQAIRRDLKGLDNRVMALDYRTLSAIDYAGDPLLEEFEAARLGGDADRMMSAFRVRRAAPRVYPAVPAALAAMERLETAIVQVIEWTIEAGAGLKTRTPNLAKNAVALWVAQYLHEVTGNIPGLTTRPEVTGPFALALQEIFEILGLPKGVQKPGKYAKLKLTSELSKKS